MNVIALTWNIQKQKEINDFVNLDAYIWSKSAPTLQELEDPRSDTHQRKNTHTPKPKEFNDFVFLESNILLNQIE